MKAGRREVEASGRRFSTRVTPVTTLQNQAVRKSQPLNKNPRHRAKLIRPYAVRAVFLRNLLGFFSNPTAYVFITLFVFTSASAAFWQPVFFSNNLANLDPLNRVMPYLLLFFIPSITMSTWADERRQGTDELLLTLPATDLDIVLGKYLAALGIYTIALVFTLSNVLILMWLGKPDLGLTFTTYLGYWLSGAMLIAVGMVASMLSSNATVAFMLGAVFAAVPIFLGTIAAAFGGPWRRAIEELSIPTRLGDFGDGLITLAGVVYFASFAAAMLYVNMSLLARRHWSGGEKSADLATHQWVRIIALGCALGGLNALVGRFGARWDCTQEGLNTLSSESITLLRQIPKDRPVYIQAYYSPEVPSEYVPTKDEFLRLLKEYQAWGGDRVRLNLVETRLYSKEAREASKRFGIEPRKLFTVSDEKQTTNDVFLGVAFSSGLEESVIPFLDRGLPIEYELTRSMRVVSRSGRKKVGILNTDAKLMGGFDMRSMGTSSEWSIVTELKKQYDVRSVAPDSELPADLDAVLVAQPSSLTQKQIDNLTAYVRKGGPTLLLLDPLPMENPQISPELPRQSPGGPFGGGPPPEQKGDLKPLLDLIGLEWPNTEIAWNSYNPHPQLDFLPPEVVFVGRGSGAKDAFNPKEIATSSLQEVVTLFPGLLRPIGGPGPEFTPLLRSSENGGLIAWRDVVQQGFMGIQGLNQNRRYEPMHTEYTLAARLRGVPADASKPSNPSDKKEDAKAEKPKSAAINVIAIADLDLISEQFFDLRRRKIENLDFDNVTFVLNCMDTLAGDDAFIALRKRRVQHRTLLRIENETRQFVERRDRQAKEAEDAAKDQLELAQKRLDKQVAEVRERKDLDERTKSIMLDSLQSVANRRLDVEKANIEDEKQRKIQEAKGELEHRVRVIQNRIRGLAILLPPLPAFMLGLIVFGVRLKRENRGANPNRLL